MTVKASTAVIICRLVPAGEQTDGEFCAAAPARVGPQTRAPALECLTERPHKGVNVSVQVRKLMASSAPVPLHVPAAPEAADAEQLQAQQQALLTLGCRTMALPIGRGALTLGKPGMPGSP